MPTKKPPVPDGYGRGGLDGHAKPISKLEGLWLVFLGLFAGKRKKAKDTQME